MGIRYNSLVDLIKKVRFLISWCRSDLLCLSPESQMSRMRIRGDMCCHCDTDCSDNYGFRCVCRSCNRVLCGKCLEGYGYLASESVKFIEFCKFCGRREYSQKIHPLMSPRQSPEPPSSPCVGGGEVVDGGRFDCFYDATSSSVASSTGHPSPVSASHHTFCRSDDEDGGDGMKHFFSLSSRYSFDISDIDSSSVSAKHEFYSFKSVGSSPLDSPSRINSTSNRAGRSVQQEHEESPSPMYQTMALLKRLDTETEDTENTDDFSDNLSIFRDQCENSQPPLDFENNGLIWFPPPPDDEDDEAESNFFEYDDEDDDVGASGAMFSSSSSLSSLFPMKEKQSEGHKEPLRAVVQGHFRALVAQLLQAEGIDFGEESSAEEWLEVVTAIAWQAANFVKPDTSKGGSMDPGDYVKVKCIASGNPSDSTLIKGIVCSKNIKHKRMTSQYKNPRLLLLGGALEYQRVPNQLASFNTLLQQEMDHLKMIVSKIEAHRTNVLLVEKSVSSYAQEYLLAKEISLVLNVKRPLLERIARSTGAVITPSIDHISTTRLGHCELFRLERVSEELEIANQLNRKPSKTLMFFEGCPRRLGCTVLLKGACREELRKIKHVVQYSVFAAYHLSLETSFLADEGATLPQTTLKPSISIPERANPFSLVADISPQNDLSMDLNTELGPQESSSDHFNGDGGVGYETTETHSDCETKNRYQNEKNEETEVTSEYFSATDNHPSILVSFSSRCVMKGSVCERSRLLRIKFYGCFDKPLGRYLHDDLFDQTSCCRSCKDPAEAHVLCYTHQQGSLTINVRRLPSLKLPGERDGKIWMWHRCLRCAQVDGVPPATRRVVMSDAAWGLSFGKFLELSFSNHATANRVASCGHSLQRDCLRYYGFGSMVAFFRYSPIDILSVHLPPSVLEFNNHDRQEWIRKEAMKLLSKTEFLYEEIADVLWTFEQKIILLGQESPDNSDLFNQIMELKDLLKAEGNDYRGFLQQVSSETSQSDPVPVDILELNRLRRALLIGSRVWDHRLHSLDTVLKTKTSIPKASQDFTSHSSPKESGNTLLKDNNSKLDSDREENIPESSNSPESTTTMNFPAQLKEEPSVSDDLPKPEKTNTGEEVPVNETTQESSSNLSDKIDSAWTGQDSVTTEVNQTKNPSFRNLMSPTRVYSFDSALRFQDKIRKRSSTSSQHLSPLRSFHVSGDYRNAVRDPVFNVLRTYSPISPREAQKLSFILSSMPSFITSASHMADGARLLLPQTGHNNLVVAVYDDEPTSIVSYALTSKEYEDWVNDKSNEQEVEKEELSSSTYTSWQSFGSLDLDHIHYGSYGPEHSSSTLSSLFTDPKKSPHVRIAFGDESLTAGGKVKFTVTCYFAKQFDGLRKKCCPSEVDFVRSLSRCKRWSAQGGKSNVFFAKTLDERFIIKQVTKTELDSFEEFAPEYFKYLPDSLNSGSPTCLAKVLGIYQVSIKYLKGGKETKMDFMVMENLFFKRSISRVYDLKGSARSRYNSDTSGQNQVLLDMNLLETLRTKPIFLGSKAKRSLERAVWNDTSFLASVDVMDYSLLVGVDDEGKELVLGIIDFMRQYTWDKHLETWVKASGILGGPKNASPTIISPKQYKRRFRKAMTTYFLAVPDQWSS